jgi:GTP-binding protein SAR1
LPVFAIKQTQELTVGSVKFRTIDLGGHEKARRVWREYFAKVDGVVYVWGIKKNQKKDQKKTKKQNKLGASNKSSINA